MVYDQERRYYVYAWYVKETYEIFYIGKGTGNRCKCKKRENKYFMNMLNSHECDYVILKNNLNEKEAFDLEKKWISVLRETNFRLTNATNGGENPPKRTGPLREETKAKISISNKKYYTEHPERAEEISQRMKNFFLTEEGKNFQKRSIIARDNDDFRKRQSEKCRIANNTSEYIERHSKIVKDMWKSENYANAHKGGNNHRAQAVKQYDIDGKFIKEYETITQASKETGTSISKISAVCKGKRKTTGGYRWEFSNDKHIVLQRENNYDPSKDKSAKPVLQYNKDGTLVNEYYSLNEACRVNNVDRSGIISNITGKTKSAYGYLWKYKYDNTVPSLQ